MPINLPDSLPSEKPASNTDTRIRNFLIAITAIALIIAISLGMRTENSTSVLENLAKNSTPLEIAIKNGKPTCIEFYADWCNSCQAMAKDLKELKQQYADKLNFVMLNVDNTKWLPELQHYRVDGIPHFVFLSTNGEEIAQNIGEIPRPMMQANLTALMASTPLPYTQSNGRTSDFKPQITPKQDDPRSHSNQSKLIP